MNTYSKPSQNSTLKMLDLDDMIKNAMKARDTNRLKAYKNIKAKKQELLTAKNAKPYDVAAEITMLKKMASELSNDYETALSAGRQDLIDEILDELNIIREFIPKEPSAEVIEKTVNEWITKNGNPDKRQMGVLINYVKECLPTADGKTVANIVKKFID